MFLRPHASAESAGEGRVWGSRVQAAELWPSVSVFSQSSSVCFPFNASGQDLVQISGFCAKFLENHPPTGTVSVLIQSESLSALAMLHFYPAICARMSTFSIGPLLLST